MSHKTVTMNEVHCEVRPESLLLLMYMYGTLYMWNRHPAPPPVPAAAPILDLYPRPSPGNVGTGV